MKKTRVYHDSQNHQRFTNRVQENVFRFNYDAKNNKGLFSGVRKDYLSR